MEAGRQAVKQAADFDQFAAQGNVAIGKMGSFDNPESRGVGERCIIGFGRNAGPPMFPNGWYNNNYLIVQGKDEVGIVVEMNHDVRHIRLNASHRTDDVRPWFGDSIGRYEGDTLVVETDHFPQAQAYSGVWKDLKVTERFTRVGKDRLYYRFTVEAPSAWDKPWGGEYEFAPLKGQLYEYACHEGNHALPGILVRRPRRRTRGPGGKPSRRRPAADRHLHTTTHTPWREVPMKAAIQAACALALALPASAALAQPTPPKLAVEAPNYVSIPMEITVNKPAAEVWKRIG